VTAREGAGAPSEAPNLGAPWPRGSLGAMAPGEGEFDGVTRVETDAAGEAAAAAAAAGVGTRLLWRTRAPTARVWEMELSPGEVAPLHTHEADYCFYVLQPGELLVRDEAGEEVCRARLRAGEVAGFRLAGSRLYPTGGSTAMGPIPATHSAENVGETTFKEVMFEYASS